MSCNVVTLTLPRSWISECDRKVEHVCGFCIFIN